MQLIKFTLVSLVLGSVFAGQSVRLGVVEERNVSTVSDLASALGSLKTNIENDLAPLSKWISKVIITIGNGQDVLVAEPDGLICKVAISLRHPITMANVSDVTDALNSVVSDIQEIAPNVESIVSSIVGPLDPKDLTSMISAMGDLQSILNDIEIIILMIIGDFEEGMRFL